MRTLNDWHVNNCTVYSGEDRSNPIAYTGAQMDIKGEGIERCQANALLIAQVAWMFNTLKIISDANPKQRDGMDYEMLGAGISEARRIVEFIEKDPCWAFLDWSKE